VVAIWTEQVCHMILLPLLIVSLSSLSAHSVRRRVVYCWTSCSSPVLVLPQQLGMDAPFSAAAEDGWLRMRAHYAEARILQVCWPEPMQAGACRQTTKLKPPSAAIPPSPLVINCRNSCSVCSLARSDQSCKAVATMQLLLYWGKSHQIAGPRFLLNNLKAGKILSASSLPERSFVLLRHQWHLAVLSHCIQPYLPYLVILPRQHKQIFFVRPYAS
jgi:hypothetical protein